MSNEFSPWVDYSLERGPIRGDAKGKVGLTLRVKARPELEDFMKNLSKGRTVSVDAYVPDGWTNLDGTGAFDVYNIDQKQLIINGAYGLTAVGGALIGGTPDPDDGGAPRRFGGNSAADTINLSFLRIVGIGKTEDGLRIGFPGAFSAAYVDSLRNRMPQVITQFLKDFIVPITINVQIISR